jgi:hypothetical protein
MPGRDGRFGVGLDATRRGLGERPAQPRAQRSACPSYLRALTWSFTLFNSLRILAYLPTLRAIAESADSSQHSLMTWLIWVGANVTTAAWLREHNGHRLDAAVAISWVNAMLCMCVAVMIFVCRP